MYVDEPIKLSVDKTLYLENRGEFAKNKYKELKKEEKEELEEKLNNEQ